MARKISAVITAPGHEPYRAYFQESTRDDGTPQVLVWTAGSPWIAYNTERFNDGVFSRDWVREVVAGSGAKVEF